MAHGTRQRLSIDLHTGAKMTINVADKSIERRARATKFEQVTYYATAGVVKLFDRMAPGMYKIAAEGAEIYVIDGQPGSFEATQWSRLEAGDYDYWECRESGEILSAYLTTGAAIRITRRCAG
jgi:hypothetical protein